MKTNQSTRGFRLMSTDDMPFHPRMFGRRGAVAAEHYLAPMAGIDILKAGGNAVDAAIAATLVEGVVNPQMNTIGGEIPILIHAPGEGAPVCINGNMVAPKGATPSAFRERGYDQIPAEGILAAGVPGAMGALLAASSRYGRLRFADVVAPAIDLAVNGFPVHSGLLNQHNFGIAANAVRFASEWPGSTALYCPGGKVPVEGTIMANPALGSMYAYLVEEEQKAGGSRETGLRAAFDAFYKGDVAREIVAFVAARDGLLQRSDFDRFQAPFEQPVSIRFEGVDLYKAGFWTQGPALLQSLSILKAFDLRAVGHNSCEYVHLVTEAIKLAFADREQFYGDPAFIDVPGDTLLSEAYGATRAGLIGPRADGSLRPGDPGKGGALLPASQRLPGSPWGPGTVHVDSMDGEGLTAAFTPSGAWIRSSEVMPALGFPLGTRLSNCRLQPPHHPNVVAPLKRPRTTISPSIATKDGKPWIAFGSMGGDQQDQWQLQFFLNRVVFGMPLNRAIEAPKFSSEHFPATFHPHEAFANRLRIEESVGTDVLDALSTRGHEVDVAPDWTEGFLCATERDPTTGVLEAAADPRGTKSDVFPAYALAY